MLFDSPNMREGLDCRKTWLNILLTNPSTDARTLASPARLISFMVINSLAKKQNRGRPRSYNVNGSAPVPPPGGWKSASADTPHGRVLVRLIGSGEVQPTAKTHKVWNKYSELQVVQPAVFPKLFRRCIEIANAPNNSIATNNPTTPPATPSISSQQTDLGNMS